MKGYIDFEGKSVEQAVEKACQELNVSKDMLAYDIISYGSTGIFGLVRTKKALIRVSASESNPPSSNAFQTKDAEAEATQTEAQNANDELEGDNRSAINALLDETFGEKQPPHEAVVMDVQSEPLAENTDKETHKASKEESSEELNEAPEAEPEEALEETEAAAPASDEAIAVAKEMLSRILALLSPIAEVSVQHDPDLCRIHINGGETAVLIGRKGQTLEAMQYLVDKAINKQCGKGYRIVVDVEGYLETRRNELKETATRLAEKAQKSGKPTTMNRMNAHDRRIVHLALKNNKAVRTQSVGDGYYRKLMILPKRKKRGSKSGGRSRQNQ